MTKAIIEVDWIDSAGIHGWQDASAIEGLTLSVMEYQAVGYLLREDEDGVTIAQAHGGEHGGLLCPFLIPRVAIRATRELRR